MASLVASETTLPCTPIFLWQESLSYSISSSDDLLQQPSPGIKSSQTWGAEEAYGVGDFIWKEDRRHYLCTPDTRFVVIWLIRLIILHNTLIFKAITFPSAVLKYNIHCISFLGLPYKVPDIGWPETTEMYYLTVLEASSLKSSCQQGCPFSEGSGEESFLASFSFWWFPAILSLT